LTTGSPNIYQNSTKIKCPENSQVLAELLKNREKARI